MRTWQANDDASLAAKTALPFAFATTNRVKSCEGVKKTDIEIKKWTQCLRMNKTLLIQELGFSSDEIKSDDIGSESRPLKALMEQVPLNGSWVRAHLSGNGFTYSFRFLITKNKMGIRQVAAFLVDIEFDKG